MPRDYIFVSYSHQDAEWLDRLRIFLKPFPWGLSYKEGGRLWADPHIQTGERWRREIGDGLARARIAVLLVSQDFLASDSIAEHELPPILEAAAAGELTIVCIPLSSSNVHRTRKELLEYQWPRPHNQPLDLLPRAEQEAALARLSRKLHEVVTAAGLTHGAQAPSTRDARPGELDALVEEQALALLANWIGEPKPALPEEARTLVRHCGYLPLAISVAGAMVRDGTAWTDLLAALEAGKLRFLDHPYVSVFTSLRLSLDALPDSVRARYLELAVVPEGVTMPVSVVTRLWAHTGDLRDYESRRLLADLERKGLLYLETRGDAASVRFHDLQWDFLRLAANDVRKLHSNLLDACARFLAPAPEETHRAWWTLPAGEPYLWDHLSDHLSKAGRRDELRALLFDHAWISAKLRASDVIALLKDFDALAADRSVGLVLGALRLSAHVLAKDHAQLAGQLTGRLLQAEDGEIGALVSQARAETTAPWLRPLAPSLMPPGGALVRTLEGHAGAVHGVAVTPDGKRAVSASGDGTLKIWDLATGAVLRTLEGHAEMVNGVAVTPNGQLAVSASADKTLKVWDLATGAVLHTLAGHKKWVSGVAVSPDGQRAISASEDKTLKVWDLATGAVLHTLAGHKKWVSGVAVTPDGQRAVSASEDKTLKVWDLATGVVLRTLEGHTSEVTGVAVTPDGQTAVSASWDDTLKVWDLATGAVLHTLEGHAHWVNGVAVTPDGKRAVSASEDRTLKVWDLATGVVLHEGPAHSRRSYARSPASR